MIVFIMDIITTYTHKYNRYEKYRIHEYNCTYNILEQNYIYIYLRLSSQHKSEGVQNVFKVEKKLKNVDLGNHQKLKKS